MPNRVQDWKRVRGIEEKGRWLPQDQSNLMRNHSQTTKAKTVSGWGRILFRSTYLMEIEDQIQLAYLNIRIRAKKHGVKCDVREIEANSRRDETYIAKITV